MSDQWKLSTITPPSVGPIVGPIITPIPKMAEAVGLSDISKASKRIDWEVDNNAPPPIPCINRHATSSQSEPETPHI
jgi:hypothetical protein